MGVICGKRNKGISESTRAIPPSPYHHLNNLTEIQVHLLENVYRSAQTNGAVDLSNFPGMFPNFKGLPSEALASVFRIFDVDQTGRVSFNNLCYVTSKYILGSQHCKCEFLSQAFNYKNAEPPHGEDVVPLKDFCKKNLKEGGDLAYFDSLISGNRPLKGKDFTEWALAYLNIGLAMEIFEIIPSPVTERKIISEILREATQKEQQLGDKWNAILRE